MIDLQFLRVSQKGLYALQALLVLARHYSDGIVTSHVIAEEENLPRKFLNGILNDLNRAQFVISKRGPDGGYKLKRAPERIFLGEVLRKIDRPLATSKNAELPGWRGKKHDLRGRLSRILLDASAATGSILDGTSLADVCETGAQNKQLGARLTKDR